MKKGFLKGFILGGLIFSTVTSFAAVTYNAITASFPVLVNGEVWESDKPIVTIDGSTYLPLKALGEVLGVRVNWNSELGQVEIGENLSSETKENKTQSVFKDSREIIATSNFNITYSYGMSKVVYDFSQLKDFAMLTYTITFYDSDENRIGYGSNVAMNKVVGETTTESMFVDGDIRNAKYVKIQIDTTL